MTNMVPNLDDLRFQKDLVDEARRRIIRYCPEWTDYNLSDPGITLIELFAFMTEALVYRLNRVPERNYLKFLEMLDMTPQPASSARTELTFYLSAPFPVSPGDGLQAIVPLGLAVSTRPSDEEEEITFTVDEKLVIREPRLVQLRREDDFNKNYLPRLGIESFYPFNKTKPKEADTFYIGFDEDQDLRGYILRLTFECAETQAVGIRRNDPPWVWECSLGGGRWYEIQPSTRRGEIDTTGGLNNPRGSMVFHLPRTIEPDLVHGRRAFWLRCRLEQRNKDQGMYTESPCIQRVTPYALGGKTTATHATNVVQEVLGTSNGDPAQSFKLQYSPVLALRADEQLQVEEKVDGVMTWVPWERVYDFSKSSVFDRHFILNEVNGEIRFGPTIRRPDGTVCQYGRTPESGRRIRINQYRFGGGTKGSVPADKIQVLRSAVPFVDRVTNFARAEGGRDAESLEELMMRSKRELRAQQRAVTAEDFENLVRGATREVARVLCNGAGPLSTAAGTRAGPTSDTRRAAGPGSVELLVVPEVSSSVLRGDFSRLALDPTLQSRIRTHLDQFRLLATVVNIREPGYMGIKVQAKIAISAYSQPEAVQTRVKAFLQRFLSPLLLDPRDAGGTRAEDNFEPDWEGWPFGRDLYISELYAQIQKVAGVKHVLEVKVSYRKILLGGDGGAGSEAAAGLVELTERSLKVPADTLLCSFEHEVEVVEL